MFNFKTIYTTLACLLLFAGNTIAQVQSKGLNNTFYPSQRNVDTPVINGSVQAVGLNNSFFSPQIVQNPIDSVFLPPELNFETNSILWAKYEEDNNYTTDGVYVQGKYFISQKFSYVNEQSVYNIYQAGIRAGSYISKRDLETGALEWEYSTNLNNNDKIELDFSLHEREDGNIEVFGFRIISTNNINFAPTGVVNRKVFDKDTGELLSQHFTEFDDGGAFCPNVNGQFGSTFPIVEDESYITNCSWGERLTASISSNNDGLLIDTVEFSESLIDLDGSTRTKYTGAKRLPSGNIAVPVSAFNESFTLDEILTEVLILDPMGVLIRRIDVSEIMDFATYMMLKVVGDKIILTGSSFQELVDLQFINADNIAVIDEMGEVYTQINEIQDYVGTRATVLDNDQLIVTARDTTDNCLHILVENNGQLESVKRMCHTDNKWSVLLRDLNQYEDQLIINGRIFRDTLLIDSNTGQASSFGVGAAPFNMSFDLNDIDPLSSQNQIAVVDNHFMVSPNPASDIIHLDFKTLQSGNILLINQLGETLRTAPVENVLQHYWQINQLSSGVYYIRFENEELVSTKKIVIAR